VSASEERVRLTALVNGAVQGVGFRDWTRRRAGALGLTGSAANLPDGRVEVVVEGPAAVCRALLGDLREGAAPGRISSVDDRWGAAEGLRDFTVA